MMGIKETTLLRILVLYSVCVLIHSFWNLGRSALNIAAYLIIILLVGVTNLICYAPMVGKLIFRKVSAFHQDATSDIPGNPHAFDDCVISLMRTLPEPSNFNICFTGMDFSRPLIMEGAVPPAVINSITLYSRSTPDPPVTLDISTLTLNPGQRLKVAFVPDSASDSELNNITNGEAISLLKYPNHWRGGFLAMRNFAVQNGTRVITPTVSTTDGTVIRPPTSQVSGLTASKGVESKKVFRVLLFNVITFSLVSNFCQKEWSLSERHVVLGGLIVGYMLYNLLFLLGKRGLHHHLSLICPHMHEFRRPDDGEASKVSQPSKEHRYWIMRYDLGTIGGDDVMVTVTMKSGGQKYWSLTVYDIYGVPIPQYVNVFNTTCNPDKEGNFKISVRLTLAPQEPLTSPSAADSSTVAATVDMNPAPKGYAIFRIVHPTSAETESLSVPVASLTKPV